MHLLEVIGAVDWPFMLAFLIKSRFASPCRGEPSLWAVAIYIHSAWKPSRPNKPVILCFTGPCRRHQWSDACGIWEKEQGNPDRQQFLPFSPFNNPTTSDPRHTAVLWGTTHHMAIVLNVMRKWLNNVTYWKLPVHWHVASATSDRLPHVTCCCKNTIDGFQKSGRKTLWWFCNDLIKCQQLVRVLSDKCFTSAHHWPTNDSDNLNMLQCHALPITQA